MARFRLQAAPLANRSRRASVATQASFLGSPENLASLLEPDLACQCLPHWALGNKATLIQGLQCNPKMAYVFRAHRYGTTLRSGRRS